MDRLLLRMHDFTDELCEVINAFKEDEAELARSLTGLYTRLMPILDSLYRIQQGRKWGSGMNEK